MKVTDTPFAFRLAAFRWKKSTTQQVGPEPPPASPDPNISIDDSSYEKVAYKFSDGKLLGTYSKDPMLTSDKGLRVEYLLIGWVLIR